MSFNEIALKMFKANISKYKLFILCNIFSIAILYSFVAILANEQFMNPKVVHSMISSNIYAPSAIILLFITIFLPYTQNVFMKSRQKDYGILLSLGLSEREMINSIFIEDFIMCIASLIFGLLLGTVFNIFFIIFVKSVIGISEIQVINSKIPYIIVFFYVFTLYIFALVVNIFSIVKTTVTEKIKYGLKTEGGKFCNIHLLYLVVIVNIIAVIILKTAYRKNSNASLISFALSVVGSIVFFLNGEAIIEYLKKKHYKLYLKYIFIISDVKYYYKKNRKTFFTTTWIFFVIMFFLMFSFAINPNLSSKPLPYNIFDMMYFCNKDKALDIKEIESIAEKNENAVTESFKVDMIRNGTFTLFCVDDVNNVLDKDYEVQIGSYIYVYPYDINDGYVHTDIKSGVDELNINSDDGNRKFSMKEYIVDPLFGKANSMSDIILLLNKEDFYWVSEKCENDYYINGVLELYNFKDWKSSEKIVDEVQGNIYKNSNIEDSEKFYNISSKIKTYITEAKGSYFAVFEVSYIAIFLYSASILMIHFKLQMEYEEEFKKYFSLFRIGITDTQIKSMISKKILLLFFIPSIYSVAMIIIYSHYIVISNENMASIIGSIVILLFLGVNYLMYKIYLNVYYKKFISSIKFL